MRDVGAHVVDEVVVVRDDADGDALEREQVRLEPVDGVAVEVVGRLVEQQQLGLRAGWRWRSRASSSSRPRAVDLAAWSSSGKPTFVERLDARLASSARDCCFMNSAHGHAVVADDLVADVPRAEVLREARDVLGRQPVEQRRLAHAVLADEAVAVAALEAQVAALEQDAAGEGEDGVLDVDGVVLAVGRGEHALGRLGQQLA